MVKFLLCFAVSSVILIYRSALDYNICRINLMLLMHKLTIDNNSGYHMLAWNHCSSVGNTQENVKHFIPFFNGIIMDWYAC